MTALGAEDLDRLASWGYAPCAGAVCLTGSAGLLIDRWRWYLRSSLSDHSQVELRPPAFIDRRVLARSGYSRNFPQHVFHAKGRSADAPARVLAPAACLHLYPLLSGTRLGLRPWRGWVEGPVARYESGRWRFPFRLSSFHMAELVVLGEAEAVERDVVRLAGIVESAFDRLGFAGGWRPATDPFFGPALRGARVAQRIRGSKHEYWPASPAVAIASSNRHEDTFGRAFDIGLRDGPAHSGCLAFGLERLTAVSLLRWGPRPDSWPAVLRP